MPGSGDIDLQLRVLGPVTLEAGGAPVRLSALERSLLARSALTSTVAGPSLEAWLWGDDAPPSAPNRIQALVSGIRRKCADAGASPLLTEGGGYRLAPGVRVDLLEHQDHRGRARSLAADGSPECLEAFRDALTLFDDEVLQGIATTPAVEIERDLLDQERLALWEEHAEAALAFGRAETVQADLAALTARHPFREVLIAHHMLALAATGQQEQALRVYRTAYDRLDEELGVAPSARLRDAHAQVLDGRPPAAAEDNGSADVTDLDVPAAPAGHDLPVPRTLPRRIPGFVGRDDALATLEDAARRAQDDAIVVHVTGLTGMGKSALAIEAGQRLRDHFPDGTLYFDAANERDATAVETVLASFLRLLGVHPVAVPTEAKDRASLFRSLLDGRRVLIVIDGVDASPGGALDLGTLMPAAAGSMAIVTSRYPIGDLAADTQLRVGPLSPESSLDLLQSVVGAERVEADPDGAADLVRILSGMPLALRVGASRAAQRPDLSLASVAAKVAEQVPDRDGLGALAAGLALVWERLPEEARDAAILISQLPTSTFSGWVPGALLDSEDAGDRAMDALVASSLVEPVLSAGRTAQYRMHDVVERLVVPRGEVPHGPDALVRVAEQLLERAGVPYLTHSTQLVPLSALRGSEAPAPLGRATTPLERRLSQEFFATENSLARACARHLASHRPDLAWRLLAVTAGAHHVSAAEGDWVAAVEEVQPHLGHDDDGRLGAAHLALCRGWHLQSRASSSAEARALADQARKQLTLLGAHSAAAAAAVLCALSWLSLGRRAEAEQDVRRAEASLAHIDDQVLAGWVAIVRGTIHNDYDELSDATREFTRAREVLSATPARAAFGQATLELSRACRRRGALGPANVLVDEALALLDGEAEAHIYSYVLDARAEVSVALGRGAEALEQADQAWRRASQSQDSFLTARARRARAGGLRLLGRLDEAAAELRTSVEEFTLIDRALSVAASLRELALVLDLQGRHAEANEVYRQERAARASAQLVTADDLEATRLGSGRTDGVSTD